MSQHPLDPRLENDTHLLRQMGSCQLLLMDNSLVPWLILVPDTEETDFHELADNQQLEILGHINGLSRFLKLQMGAQKLNIATIGNIVNQMHIHIVGRHPEDYCWPGVVWGATGKTPYTEAEVEDIRRLMDGFKMEGFK